MEQQTHSGSCGDIIQQRFVFVGLFSLEFLSMTTEFSPQGHSVWFFSASQLSSQSDLPATHNFILSVIGWRTALQHLHATWAP